MKTLRSFSNLLAVSMLTASSSLQAKPFTQDQVRSTSHAIDQLVASHLLKSKVKANPIIDDATFARRSYISISGRIPTLEEAEQFIDDPTPNKRRALVDSLIHSPGYRSRMFNFWADLLRLQTNHEQYGVGWHVWIRDATDSNKPYDQFIYEMLSAEGLAAENPAVGYYLRDRNMLLDNVSNTVQVFLGNRIGCAQCHDHPFDDWTQKQYYELAAFTGGTTYNSDSANTLLRDLVKHTLQEKGIEREGKARKAGNKKKNRKTPLSGEAKKIARDYNTLFKDFRKNAITTDPRKQLVLPDDYHYNDGKPGDTVQPQTLFGDPLKNIAPEDRRKAFAKWVTSRENPYFTKVIVNRLWAEVFGRGIVDPLDDWSETTRISHPELLDLLCQVMQATDYDVQQFMRVLYHTRLFESAAASEEAARGRSYDFKGPLLRRMSAEEIHDSFKVMEFGNQDDQKNPSLEQRWKEYSHSINTILNMPLPQLVALDDAADELEKKVSSLKSQARTYREQAIVAKGEGDMKKSQSLQKKASDIYRQSKRMERQGTNQMMSMVMDKRIRAKPRVTLRSSEQPAPFKAGSFMRQFGASDRLTPDASDTKASIPQALTLLNGYEINQVTDGKGRLATKLRAAQSDSQRLETLFLTIYGTRPSSEEQIKYQVLTNNAAELRALARAMMNSKRFLFVQ